MFVFDVVSWRAVVYCMVAAVACCTAVLVLRFWCCDLVLRLADKSLIGCNLVLRFGAAIGAAIGAAVMVLRLVLQLVLRFWCWVLRLVAKSLLGSFKFVLKRSQHRC
jgi:hypothetical protein